MISQNLPKITAISPHPPYKEQYCSLSDVLSSVVAGNIIIIRNSDFMADKLSQFNEIAFKQLEKSMGSPVEIQTWQKLHHFVDSSQLLKVNQEITKITQSFLLDWAKQFVTDFLNYPQRFYLYSNGIFRAFVPYDIFVKNQNNLEPYLGSLKFTSPHRDSWVEYSESSINLWIAVDQVSLGNSILLYPQYWGKKIPLPSRIHHIDRDHPLEKPIRFQLQPGDALLFSGEHLHSSELNITEETRCALTMRFSLTFPKPTYFNQWRSWYDSRWISHRWRRLALWRSFFSDAHFGYRLKNQKKRWNRIKSKFFKVKSSSQSAIIPKDDLKTDLKTQSHPIQVKDAHTCVVQTQEGLIEFPRYCPHLGADLAQGYIEDGKLYCSWHNLAFDLKTGEANCTAFCPLILTKQETIAS